MGPVRDVTGLSDYHDTISTKGKLVVVDFGASWCGHCVRIAPDYEALAARYPDVVFAKVSQDKTPESGDICAEYGASSFPTFVFFLNGEKKDEIKGANIPGVEAKVVELNAATPKSFEGSGFSLGGSTSSPHDAAARREAQLKRFGGGDGGGNAKKSSTTSSSSSSSSSSSTSADAAGESAAAPMQDDDDDGAALQAALQLSMDADAAASAAAGVPTAPSPAAAAEAPPPPAMDTTNEEGDSPASASPPVMVLPPVNETLLREAVDMGFSEVRARKALVSLTQPTAESVINWVLEHGEDAGIDDPIAFVPEQSASSSSGGGGGGGGGGEAVSRSWKCVETGRLFKSMDELQQYAEKTGRSNFEESTEEKKALTPEEIAAKKQALQDRLVARRAEKQSEEKVAQKQSEVQRRNMGKEVAATREEMDKALRAREFALAKREKEDAKKERERLKAEIAKDKAERKSRGGTLSSVLSMDGYAPSGMSAQLANDFEKDAATDSTPPSSSSSSLPAVPGAASASANPGACVDDALVKIAKHKVGGDGGKCLKLLGLYLKNVAEKPLEGKYRSIKCGDAFRLKVKSIIGGVALLKAVGFVATGDGATMELSADHDVALLKETLGKLDAAMQAYLA